MYVAYTYLKHCIYTYKMYIHICIEREMDAVWAIWALYIYIYISIYLFIRTPSIQIILTSWPILPI